MPVGGFGNLIALRLQRRARELGNSVFIDHDLRPYNDQWAFWAARPYSWRPHAGRGRECRRAWRMTPPRRPKAGLVGCSLSGKITIVVADQLYIDRSCVMT